jgi:hypothetical protein
MELITFPSDRFTSWYILLARLLVPLCGGFLIGPLLNGWKRLKPFMAWMRADPVRFRIWLLCIWWPMCNVRRLVLALAPGTPSCLHVSLAKPHSRPVARLLRTHPPRPQGAGRMRICVVSDTHGLHEMFTRRIPPCDLLIHCGDIMTEDRGASAVDGGAGATRRLEEIGRWLAQLPCSAAVLIGGNHDAILEHLGAPAVRAALRRGAKRAEPTRVSGQGQGQAEGQVEVVYLSDESITVQGLRIWGTPLNGCNSAASQNRAFQPACGAGADDPKMRSAAAIPPGGIDVLVSHGPPSGILDGGVGVGLLRELSERERPLLHVFGHQHLAYGVAFEPCLGTTFANAAGCDGFFAPIHPPILIDLCSGEPRREGDLPADLHDAHHANGNGAQRANGNGDGNGAQHGQQNGNGGLRQRAPQSQHRARASEACARELGSDAACEPAETEGFQFYATAAATLLRSPWTLEMQRTPFGELTTTL